MTSKKEKTVITFETYQRIYMRKIGKKYIWCETCSEESLLVTPIVAARLSQKSVREIFQMVEEGKVHFFVSKTGNLMICCNSLKDEMII